MFRKLEELADEQNGLKARLRKEGEVAVKEALNEFFEAHPEVVGIAWAQYTPYFNDGDPCYFRVADPEFYLTEEGQKAIGKEPREVFVDDISFTYCDEGFSTYSLKGQLKKDAEKLVELFEVLEDTLEMVFGDHAEIVATRDEIRVDQYDHD